MPTPGGIFFSFLGRAMAERRRGKGGDDLLGRRARGEASILRPSEIKARAVAPSFYFSLP